MKIFGSTSNIGTKASNIILLYKYNFSIPDTCIVQQCEIKNFNFSSLTRNGKYILRPNFLDEDGKYKSSAGLYKSRIFKNSDSLKIFIKKHLGDLGEELGGSNENLLSIIIQKFIEADSYGVYFSKAPQNILKKGFYELAETHNSITAGKAYFGHKLKLTFFQEQELTLIGNKLETICNSPQDIEFCIKNGKIIILQTRDITTGNNTIYSFPEIREFNGIYKNLDFDELGEKQDLFSYLVLQRIFNCIYINGKIYFKKSLFPYLSFKNIPKTENGNLQLFLKYYKKYLRKKLLFKIQKIFSLQKLDKSLLQIFFKEYHYSFLLDTASHLQLNFSFKNTNSLSKKFLKLERYKNKAFTYLEQYKTDHKENGGRNYFGKNDGDFGNTLILKNGLILNQKAYKQGEIQYIYKGKISGRLTDLENLKHIKNNEQILIIEHLDFKLYDVLPYINGLIVRYGNLLSHNSIILCEYRIPSIIQYKDFNNLRIGEKISI